MTPLRIMYYKEEIAELNKQLSQERRKNSVKQISDETPEKLLGYFPLKSINDGLGAKKYIDIMQTAVDFRFIFFNMISALISSRAVYPCSKPKPMTK